MDNFVKVINKIERNFIYFISIFIFSNMMNFFEVLYLKENFSIYDSLYRNLSSSICTFLLYLIFINKDEKKSLRNIIKIGLFGAVGGVLLIWIIDNIIHNYRNKKLNLANPK